MDLSTLNERQKKAVNAPLGPVLVLAGPGSGKTKTLTYRIAHLIESKTIHPKNILALTFTNKAAKEMRSRVSVLLSRFVSASELLTMGTFHSVCAKILRKEIHNLGYGYDFVIFDTDDQRKQLSEILEDLRIDTKKTPTTMFSALISRAKNLLQMPSELALDLDSPFLDKLFEVYSRYQDSMHKQNALDFDDLLMLSVKLFQNFDTILKKYQDQFKYILVDEYQDTNLAQYQFLRLLASHENIFAVGDDAQSIYGFRGSDIRNILNYEKDFKNVLEIKLEQNYRSTPNILSIAQKVIELNTEQKPKTLWTQNLHGEKVSLYELQNERAEAEFVAKKIISLASGLKTEENNSLEYDYSDSEDIKGYSILDKFLKARKLHGAKLNEFRGSSMLQMPKKHDSLKEYAVLYRTHAQSRAIEEVFIESGIPYQIVGGLKFYERKEIKDMLSYLRLVLNFRDLVSLKRVINEPPRGIGDKSYQIIRDFILDLKIGSTDEASSQITTNNKHQLLVDFRQKLTEIKLPPKQWQSTQDFFSMLEEFSNTSDEFKLTDVLKKIFKRSGYEAFLRDGSEQGENRIENVLELNTVAGKFSSLPWREGAVLMLEEVALISEIDQKDETKDAVTLMTLHSAKGLEFDNVFFVGLEEGILPHSRSLMNTDELGEEIRLAYVGLTRARKRLFLVFASGRRMYGDFRVSTPSRILKVMPKAELNYNQLAERLWPEDGELTLESL